jgi:alpha-glucosidase (family GH31 glycosyl hydrolase)
MRSAELGYAVVGSDVGGYGGSDIPAEVYIRWAQFSAFCGLFLNGGHGERMLWKRSPEELEIIRKFAWLHNELVPYIYSHVVECNRGGKPLMRPVEGQYQYMFGGDFLVAPIYEAGGTRSVTLPEGRWRYFFNHSEVIEGPATVERTAPIDEALVFVREGAVVPLNVSRAYTGLGDADSAGRTTWLIYPGESGEFTLHNATEGQIAPVSTTTARVEAGNPLRITLSGEAQPHIVRIHAASAPKSVEYDGAALSDGDWDYDADLALLQIRAASATSGEYRIEF